MAILISHNRRTLGVNKGPALCPISLNARLCVRGWHPSVRPSLLSFTFSLMKVRDGREREEAEEEKEKRRPDSYRPTDGGREGEENKEGGDGCGAKILPVLSVRPSVRLSH